LQLDAIVVFSGYLTLENQAAAIILINLYTTMTPLPLGCGETAYLYSKADRSTSGVCILSLTLNIALVAAMVHGQQNLVDNLASNVLTGEITIKTMRSMLFTFFVYGVVCLFNGLMSGQ